MSKSKTLRFTTDAENLPDICRWDQHRTVYDGVEYLLNFVSAKVEPEDAEPKDKVLVEFDLLYRRLSSDLPGVSHFKCYPFVEINKILRHSKGHVCYDK